MSQNGGVKPNWVHGRIGTLNQQQKMATGIHVACTCQTTSSTVTIKSPKQDSNEAEESKPSFNTEILRHCEWLDVEGFIFKDVTVTIKSLNKTTLDSRVKIRVKNSKGKVIYKNTFRNDYLYIFSDGQIQVGIPKFNKLIIYPYENEKSKWYGKIRWKEGIW
jgi:hypothetical protein